MADPLSLPTRDDPEELHGLWRWVAVSLVPQITALFLLMTLVNHSKRPGLPLLGIFPPSAGLAFLAVAGLLLFAGPALAWWCFGVTPGRSAAYALGRGVLMSVPMVFLSLVAYLVISVLAYFIIMAFR